MHSVEDADPQGHEGLGEVNDFLPLRGDGEGCHSQVCLLLEGKQMGRREGGTRQRWAVRDTRGTSVRVRAETVPLACWLLTLLWSGSLQQPCFCFVRRKSPVLLRLTLNSLYSQGYIPP